MDIVQGGCPYSDCADFGELHRENLHPQARYGSGAWTLQRCRTCGRTFSERRWTPFFRLHLAPERAVAGLKLLAEGHSIRATAEQLGVDKNTVLNVLKRACTHARWFQTSVVREFGWTPAAGDSLYAFLRGRARKRSLRERIQGRAPRPPGAVAAGSEPTR